jgi:hypothetical protein
VEIYGESKSVTKVIGCLIVLVGLAFTQVAKADVAAFCDTCSTDAQYKSFAKSMALNQTESEVLYFIVNTQTSQARKVTVFKEPDVGGYITTAFVQPAASDELAFYSTAVRAFSSGEYLVPMPPSTSENGGGSFSQFESQTVNDQINRQPWMPVAVTSKANLWDAIWAMLTNKFRKQPIAIVVFLNGDVAKFQVVNPAGGALCCTYIAGSARDKYGNFINDAGLGGNGHMSGGSYVKAGPTGNVIIMTSTVFYGCASSQSGPTECYIIEE